MSKVCGSCLFAEGGDKVEFKNGTINYKYECSCLDRNKNIVILGFQTENFIWYNQKSCEKFEPTTSHLKKREDLNEIKGESQNYTDGYFEVINDIIHK